MNNKLESEILAVSSMLQTYLEDEKRRLEDRDASIDKCIGIVAGHLKEQTDLVRLMERMMEEMRNLKITK